MKSKLNYVSFLFKNNLPEMAKMGVLGDLVTKKNSSLQKHGGQHFF